MTKNSKKQSIAEQAAAKKASQPKEKQQQSIGAMWAQKKPPKPAEKGPSSLQKNKRPVITKKRPEMTPVMTPTMVAEENPRRNLVLEHLTLWT